jgi:hypothetical protein
MENMTNSNLLDEKEVRSRLESYTDPEVTDELYGFGQLLLGDVIDRIAKADSSAFGMAAYCGGLIAVVISIYSAWRGASNSDSWTMYMVAFALLSVLIAGALAIYSTTPRDTEWFSPNEWMSKNCLTGSDRLKRYYILALWGVVRDHQARYRTRVRILAAARWILVGAGGLLLVAFLNVARRNTSF